MKKRKKNFVNNADLLEETIKSQERGQMTDKLALMLMKMCERYKASKSGNFIRYTYFEEMKSAAIENLVKNGWCKFDTTKYTNAFAFYTSCIHNSYLQYIKYEKKHRDIRDSLLVENGMDASFRYMEENSSGSDYNSDDLKFKIEQPANTEE